MLRRHLIAVAAASVAALSAARVAAEIPNGWWVAGSKPAEYDVGVEAQNGGKVAYIAAKPNVSDGFGTLMQGAEPGEYRGKRLKLSASMRTADAARAQLWLRVDGPNREVLGFDNMDDRPIVGTTGWKRYEIVLQVPPESTGLAYGFFLSGKGKVWADAFKLEVVADNTPTTGSLRRRRPANLSFDESRAPESEDTSG